MRIYIRVWLVFVFVLASLGLDVRITKAACQVECTWDGTCDHGLGCNRCKTGACGKSDARSQGGCGPGTYQCGVNGTRCCAYGPTSGSGGGDSKEPSGCPCGTKTCDQQDGGKKECWCEPKCEIVTCGSVAPQNTVTDQTSGDFYLYGFGITKPSNLKDGFIPYVTTNFWVEGPTGARKYYTGVDDQVDAATVGNWHGVADLSNHSGYGVANIGVDVYRLGVFQSSCTSSFTRPRTITGMVYYDPGNTCSTAQPWNKSDTLIVGYNNTGVTYGADVIGTVVEASDVLGKYVIGDAPAGTVSLQLLNLDSLNPNYTCSSCNPQGCPNIAGVPSPSTGNNFFLTDNLSRSAWWQVTGAGIYAGGGGTAIKSTLPDSSTNLIMDGTKILIRIRF